MSGSWGSVLGQLVPLALVVAMSPLTIVPAVLLVLHSPRPRPTGLAFLFGWLVGLAAVTAVFVQVPRLLEGMHMQAPPWAAWVRVVGGVVLLALGVWRWTTRGRSSEPPTWMNRVARVTPASAAVIGLVLILVNPKVLVMNAAAGLIIGTAEFGAVGTWLTVAYYTALAGCTVAVPVLAHFVAGERIDVQLERVRSWMQRQHAVLTAALLVAIGVALLYTGIRALI